jgi:hypothetical protein
MPEYFSYGITGKIRLPSRLMPWVMASRICWSLQPPNPVSLSEVMLVL